MSRNKYKQHELDLFDKLILPNLNYGLEVWGLNDRRNTYTFS